MEGWRRQGGEERAKRDQGRFGGWQQWGIVTERDEAGLFLTFLSFSRYDGLPSKRPAGIEHCWSPVQINFLADHSFFYIFFLRQITRRREREIERNVSVLVLFRLCQSPKRQMKSWSLLFHDNNHLVTPHISFNLSYTSLQINLCQPLFDIPLD